MNKYIVEKDILKNIDIRNYLANKTEVLTDIKPVTLLPGLNLASTEMVAEYYDTLVNTVRGIIARFKKEIEKDGAKLVSKADLVDYYRKNNFEVDEQTYKTLVKGDGQEFYIANRGMFLLTEKAFIRVGLLMRKNEVAKQLRSKLINIMNEDDEIDTYDMKKKCMKPVYDRVDSIAKQFGNFSCNNGGTEPVKKRKYPPSKVKITKREQVLLQNFVENSNSKKVKEAITTMITRLAIKRRHRTTAICWNEFCVLLKSKKGIQLAPRRHKGPQYKNMALVDLINRNEYEDALYIAMYLCSKYEIDTEKFLLEV